MSNYKEQTLSEYKSSVLAAFHLMVQIADGLMFEEETGVSLERLLESFEKKVKAAKGCDELGKLLYPGEEADEVKLLYYYGHAVKGDINGADYEKYQALLNLF